MKTLLMLSMLILTTVSVNSHSRNGAGNKKADGNKSLNTSTVRNSNSSRQKTVNNSQATTRTIQKPVITRNSTNNNAQSSIRRSVVRSSADVNRNRNTVLAENNSNSGSSGNLSLKRERNYSVQNERNASKEIHSGNRSYRTAERGSTTSRNNNPVIGNGHSEMIHGDHSGFVSHHSRVEHWNVNRNARLFHFRPLSYRRIHFPFIIPRLACLIWSMELRNEYYLMYPEFRIRQYHYGYNIPSVSAYDASDYIGEVATVYGEVMEAEYSIESDEYYLYIGQEFPYQDFSIVLPGYIARMYSSSPVQYYQGANVVVSGLITSYNDQPEILVKRANQISRYFR